MNGIAVAMIKRMSIFPPGLLTHYQGSMAVDACPKLVKNPGNRAKHFGYDVFISARRHPMFSR